MITNVKFTDMTHDETARAYAEEKFSSFAKLMDEAAYAAAVCDVELKRITRHQSGEVWYADVTLKADGKVYRASREEGRLEKTIDKLKDDILQELRVGKQKHEHSFKKGAQQIKEMVREV